MIYVQLMGGRVAGVEDGRWYCSDARLLAALQGMEPTAPGYFLSLDDRLAQTAIEMFGGTRMPGPTTTVVTTTAPDDAVY